MKLFEAVLSQTGRDRSIHFAAKDSGHAYIKAFTLADALSKATGTPVALRGPREVIDGNWLTYRGYEDACMGTPCPELASFRAYVQSYQMNRLEIAGVLTAEESSLLLPF